jgi:F420-dependent oxidoreductase-like protein
MTQHTQQLLTSADVSRLPNRERLGLIIEAEDATSAIKKIREAEEAGVAQVWMTQPRSNTDTLTLFAAAAVQTKQIRFGTAIVPTYPRHPLVMIQQAMTLENLAPGRLRLGIGPSHRPIIEGVYGLPMPSPLAHLREYLAVMRSGLWEGKIDQHGAFFNVSVSGQDQAHIPLLISTLGLKAFELAGEISDGAISWVAPPSYLLQKALPALRAGAETGKRPAPPLVAYVQVALSSDKTAILAATKQRISHYPSLPFYRNMFAEAGFPVTPEGEGLEALAGELVIAGDTSAVKTRLLELLESGLDELLIALVTITDEASERQQLSQLIASL